MERIQGLIKGIKGFSWIRNAILDNPNFTGSDIMVYLSLMRFMNNETKECYPAINTLKKRSRLGQRAVYRALNKLEQLQLIIIDRTRGRVNKYVILEPPASWEDATHNDDEFTDHPF